MMTKRSLYGFLLGTALMVLPTGASAQAVAELMPTGQWVVNQAGVQGLSQAGATQSPCIMANQYHNGFILRMAGGNQQLMSLSLDFRQNAFTQGQTYPAVVSIDGGKSHNLTATAFSPGILIIGVREAQGLYAEIQAGRSMALNVVGNTIIFSLDRVGEGLQRLESCYSPPRGAQPAAQQIASVTPKPIATKPDTEVYVKRGEYPEFKQPSAQDILKAGDAPAPLQSATPTVTPAPAAVASAAPAETGMQIASGAPQPLTAADRDTPSLETLPQTLPPLSQQEMADLNITAEDLAPYEPSPGMKTTAKSSAPVAEPMVPRGPSVKPVEMAALAPAPTPMPAPVQEPIAPQTSSVKPVMTDAPRPVSLAANTQRTSAAPEMIRSASASGSSSQQWEAEAGEDIRQVLTRWSERAGVDLVWEANNNGKVAQNIALNGSFEDAVAQIMADNAAVQGLRAQMDEGDTMAPIGMAQASTAPVSLTSSANASVWQAKSGDDLKLVLQTWASQNNVDLNWRADEKFALQAPVSGASDFASAIEAALGQFDNQSVRPVGQLNRDPHTGRLSLIIETDRAS